METPDQFALRLKTIVSMPYNKTHVRTHFEWGTLTEARAHLKGLRQTQKELRLVKKEIEVALKTSYAEYAAQKTTAPSKPDTSRQGGKKVAARGTVGARKSIRDKQAKDTIARYKKLVGIADRAILAIDRPTLVIKTWIADHRSKRLSTGVD